MDELNAAFAEEQAAAYRRGLAAGHRPAPSITVETRALVQDLAEAAPATAAVVVDVTDAPAEPERLEPPVVSPMVWCATCGKVFQYVDAKRKCTAVLQLRRHEKKEHGEGYDTRGPNPERRKRQIAKAKRRNWKDPAFRQKNIEAIRAAAREGTRGSDAPGVNAVPPPQHGFSGETHSADPSAPTITESSPSEGHAMSG